MSSVEVRLTEKINPVGAVLDDELLLPYILPFGYESYVIADNVAIVKMTSKASADLLIQGGYDNLIITAVIESAPENIELLEEKEESATEYDKRSNSDKVTQPDDQVADDQFLDDVLIELPSNALSSDSSSSESSQAKEIESSPVAIEAEDSFEGPKVNITSPQLSEYIPHQPEDSISPNSPLSNRNTPQVEELIFISPPLDEEEKTIEIPLVLDNAQSTLTEEEAETAEEKNEESPEEALNDSLQLTNEKAADSLVNLPFLKAIDREDDECTEKEEDDNIEEEQKGTAMKDNQKGFEDFPVTDNEEDYEEMALHAQTASQEIIEQVVQQKPFITSAVDTMEKLPEDDVFTALMHPYTLVKLFIVFLVVVLIRG